MTQTAAQAKYERMTQTPVAKLVCTLAVPTILSMLVSSIYNMADTFFVAQLGTSATGGVGVCFPVMTMIQAIGLTFGHGSGNILSRLLGEQKTEEAGRVAATAFFSAIGMGLLLTILGLSFQRPLVRLLGATETITPYALDYLRMILISAPFMASSFVLNNQLRYQGSAMYAFIGIGAGAVLNIALDPLFLFVFNMGVSGAALATCISQIAGFCILFFQCRRGGNIAIRLRNYRFDLGLIGRILRTGLPTFCRNALGTVASILMNTVAGGFGDAAVAAMTIVTRVFQFALSALPGFGQGFQPVCGFNYGARRYDRVLGAFWFCVKLTTLLLAAIGLLGFLFAPRIVGLFQKNDPEVLRIGALALRCQFAVFPLSSFTILAMMMTQTIGASGKSSLLALARQGLYFVPLVLLLPRFIGVLGLQIAQPIADILAFATALAITWGVLKRLKRQCREELTRAGAGMT